MTGQPWPSLPRAFVRPTTENAARVMRALEAFGAPLAALDINAVDFATPGKVIQLGMPPLHIDILTARLRSTSKSPARRLVGSTSTVEQSPSEASRRCSRTNAPLADRRTARVTVNGAPSTCRATPPEPAESEQIVTAMRAAARQVTYVVYSDEGHGLARPENRLDFAARVETFFSSCLGLRAEPLPAGGKQPGSSATVMK